MTRRGYWLRAQSKRHGPLMYFTGKMFSDTGKPQDFKLWWTAMKMLRKLKAEFPILSGYNLSVVGPKGITQVNPKRKKFTKRFTSAQEARRIYEQLARQNGPVKKRNPVKRKRRRNPETRTELAAAGRLLKNFSGHAPDEVLRVNEKKFRTGLAVGPVLALAYQTVRDGQTEDYVHEFRKTSRPLLAASHDGRTLRIVGGRFQFTEAGIEDR